MISWVLSKTLSIWWEVLLDIEEEADRLHDQEYEVWRLIEDSYFNKVLLIQGFDSFLCGLKRWNGLANFLRYVVVQGGYGIALFLKAKWVWIILEEMCGWGWKLGYKSYRLGCPGGDIVCWPYRSPALCHHSRRQQRHTFPEGKFSLNFHEERVGWGWNWGYNRSRSGCPEGNIVRWPYWSPALCHRSSRVPHHTFP